VVFLCERKKPFLRPRLRLEDNVVSYGFITVPTGLICSNSVDKTKNKKEKVKENFKPIIGHKGPEGD